MVWHPTGVHESELLRTRRRSLEIEGRPVLLLVLGTRVVALAGACPHEGADLGDASFEDGRLVCALHGATFDAAAGTVLADPHGVEPPAGAVAALARYPTQVVNGEVEVDIAEPP